MKALVCCAAFCNCCRYPSALTRRPPTPETKTRGEGSIADSTRSLSSAASVSSGLTRYDMNTWNSSVLARDDMAIARPSGPLSVDETTSLAPSTATSPSLVSAFMIARNLAFRLCLASIRKDLLDHGSCSVAQDDLFAQLHPMLAPQFKHL